MIIIDVLEFLFLVSNKFIMRYLFVTVLNISEFAFHNNFQYSSCMLCNCLNGNELMSFWIYSFHSTRWNKAESSKQNEFIPIFFFDKKSRLMNIIMIGEFVALHHLISTTKQQTCKKRYLRSVPKSSFFLR